MTNRMLTFGAFLSGPGGRVLRRLGVTTAGIVTWRELTECAVQHNRETNGGFAKAARELAGAASSGEMVLLQALLHATDFSRLADEIAEGRAWRMMDHVSGEYQTAAACIARID